jgi:RNA polymerase-binding protein DksA
MPGISHASESVCYSNLRRRLERHRAEILRDMRVRMREARQQNEVASGVVLDVGDLCETDIREDLDFALIEIENETLAQIDRALDRLDSGDFGTCVDCGDEIPESRLEALPFASRCRFCQERREAGGPQLPVHRDARPGVVTRAKVGH